MSSYLLDTNICIYISKQRPVSVLNKFKQMTVGQVGMSVITYGELWYGAKKSSFPKKTMQLLENLIQLIPPLPLPVQTAICYGEIREALEKKGKSVGGNDLWIAAHALASRLTIVTNNMREFSRIPGLKLENWVENLSPHEV